MLLRRKRGTDVTQFNCVARFVFPLGRACASTLPGRRLAWLEKTRMRDTGKPVCDMQKQKHGKPVCEIQNSKQETVRFVMDFRSCAKCHKDVSISFVFFSPTSLLFSRIRDAKKPLGGTQKKSVGDIHKRMLIQIFFRLSHTGLFL